MKSNRMFSILNLLINNQRMTADQLAEKLEVSKRTIYRDIEALNMAGIPVISFPGQGGGLGILDHYKLDNKFLSPNELEKIFIGLNAVKSIEQKNDINTLIHKLDAYDHPELFENADTLIDLSSWFDDNVLLDYLNDFKKVIREQSCIQIDYQANNGFSQRIIEPHKLVFKYNAWYLFAYCLEKNAFRLFKTKRIISFKILDQSFEMRDYDKNELSLLVKNDYFKKSSQKEIYDITLKYHKDDEQFLMDEIGVQKFNFNTERCTFSFQATQDDWLYDFIIGLTSKVKVIKPMWLEEDIKSTINKMYNLYKES